MKCLLACWERDVSQQPIRPQCAQRRRWNHQPWGVARQSTHPVPLGGVVGSNVASYDIGLIRLAQSPDASITAISRALVMP